VQSEFVFLGAAGLVLGAVLALQSCRHRPTPEERLEIFIQKKIATGYKTVFRDQVEGKTVVLLLEDCKVYRLESAGEEVTQTEVLRPGFVLWFTGCMSQKVWRDGGYLFAELVNMQVGAGGGNASGGTYRSKNAVDWEKQVGKRWLPVAEAQE
jgi:hypothetical protein